jgi:hypothetical protein
MLEAPGPYVTFTLGVDELNCDPEPISYWAETPLNDVSHSQFLGDIANVQSLTFKGKCRIARHHQKAWNSRQQCRDVLG